MGMFESIEYLFSDLDVEWGPYGIYKPSPEEIELMRLWLRGLRGLGPGVPLAVAGVATNAMIFYKLFGGGWSSKNPEVPREEDEDGRI